MQSNINTNDFIIDITLVLIRKSKNLMSQSL
jgi:hypothetical protein